MTAQRFVKASTASPRAWFATLSLALLLAACGGGGADPGGDAGGDTPPPAATTLAFTLAPARAKLGVGDTALRR